VIDMPASGRERVAAGVLVGAAVLFVGFAIPRAAVVGFFGALTLPLVLLAADLVIAAAVVTWWYPIRPAAQGLAVFGILVHALVMLRGGPIWTRGCSGVLLLVHSWALLRLFLMTAAEDDLDDDADHDSDDAGEGRPDFGLPPRAAPGQQAGLVETPVTQVVEVAAPAEPDGVDQLTEEPARDASPAAEPADDEPADDKPADDKPADDKPADGERADEEPGTHGRPEYARDADEPEHEHEERIR
jgi:hypothetical protein